jgi:hypothetical protein
MKNRLDNLEQFTNRDRLVYKLMVLIADEDGKLKIDNEYIMEVLDLTEEKVEASMKNLKENNIFRRENVNGKEYFILNEPENKKMTYNVEYVKWMDSYGCSSNWAPISKIDTIMQCETVGFVISETDELISLANSIGYETELTHEQANGVMTIPKVCITYRAILNL